MKRLLFLVLAFAGGVVAPANAGPTEVRQIQIDCQDGSLARVYALTDLREARRTLPADIAAYSPCLGVIDQAIRAYAPPSVPPVVSPAPGDTSPAKPKVYSRFGWDLRRRPANRDCGNLQRSTGTFYPLSRKKGISAFNVKRFRTSCEDAILLLLDKRLRGYRGGKRSARGYRCTGGRQHLNRSISRIDLIRTITCRKNRRKVQWQVKTGDFRL